MFCLCPELSPLSLEECERCWCCTAGLQPAYDLPLAPLPGCLAGCSMLPRHRGSVLGKIRAGKEIRFAPPSPQTHPQQQSWPDAPVTPAAPQGSPPGVILQGWTPRLSNAMERAQLQAITSAFEPKREEQIMFHTLNTGTSL